MSKADPTNAIQLVDEEISGSDLSWSEIMERTEDLVTVSGNLLVSKQTLEAIPHVITSIRYQEYKNDRGYVSIEATVADESTLFKAENRIPGVNAEERVVYNDGSTGIRRQITKMLHTMGLIVVAGNVADDSAFDIGFLDWKTYPGRESGDLPYFRRNPRGGPLLIWVRRGLQVSKYSNDHGDAETWYLA